MLKDIWKDLEDATPGVPDSGSDISVEPINEIAHAVIEVENNKADVSLSNVSNEDFKNKAESAGVGDGNFDVTDIIEPNNTKPVTSGAVFDYSKIEWVSGKNYGIGAVVARRVDNEWYGAQAYSLYICTSEHISVNFSSDSNYWEEIATRYAIETQRAYVAVTAKSDGYGRYIYDTYATKDELESIRKLKPLKTITLEEDVASLDVDFDKPLDDIAILFDVTFAVAENKPIGVRTDSGNWYMFYVSGDMKTDTKQLFYAHAREISERYWEEIVSGSFFFTLQGISGSTTTPKLIVSKRPESISRYVEKLNIFFPGRTEGQAIKAGSTITIWGHEANEEI